MTTRSLEDIYSYEKQALEQLPRNHPHYGEIVDLLNKQIQDEIWEHANTRPN